MVGTGFFRPRVSESPVGQEDMAKLDNSCGLPKADLHAKQATKHASDARHKGSVSSGTGTTNDKGRRLPKLTGKKPLDSCYAQAFCLTSTCTAASLTCCVPYTQANIRLSVCVATWCCCQHPSFKPSCFPNFHSPSCLSCLPRLPLYLP